MAILDGLYPTISPAAQYLACGSRRMTVARIAGRTGSTVHLDAITDVGPGLWAHWYNPGGAPSEQLLYFDGASALRTVNTPPPFVSQVHAVRAFNAVGAGGGAWIGTLLGGSPTVHFSAGGSLSGRLEVPAGVVVDQTGRSVFLNPGQTQLFQRTAAGVVGVVDSAAAITRPHVATQGIVWQRFEGGQQITYGQRGSGIERVHATSASEFWSVPIDTPVGPWILTHTDTTLFLRAWGRTTVTVVQVGHTDYPHAVYSAAEGGFYVAWSDAAGVLQVTFVALDVTTVPAPGSPNPIPGGGGSGPGPGGSFPGGASSLTVTPSKKFVPTRRAVYPHVKEVQDDAAAQSLKLLWDRMFELQERYETTISQRFDELGGRIDATNTRIDQQVPQIAASPAEGLATNIPSGGVPGSGSGGDPGGGPSPGPGAVPLPNLLSVVIAYANANPAELANSCQSSGGTWDFMDGVVAALRAVDPRVGYNGKRGNVADPSHDAIAYYWGPGNPTEGDNRVYVIDIIGGHCGPNPVPAWSDVTAPGVLGAWITRGMF